MTIKVFKANFYKKSARFYYIYSILLWPALITLWALSFITNLTAFYFLAIVLLLFIAPWIRVWGWYHTYFRYITYFVAWICSLFRRLWEKWWVKVSVLVAAVHLLQWARYELFFNTGGLYLHNFIHLEYIIRTLIIMALFLVFYGLFKARKHIHVVEFNDFTGSKNEELKATVNGLGVGILNEMNRVSLLLRTIDEIQPEQKFETVVPSINIQDYGKDIEEIVGTQSTVAIGSFLKIPLSQILNFFSRLVHGPKLQGGLHVDGDNLILTAQLKGGKFNGSWNVSSDEIEELPLPDTETGKIVKMIEILVYKIFAFLGGSGSPRWKAVMYYTRGLKLYRDSVRQKEQEQLNLIQAKDAFSFSIRDDSEFVQCYYNLGIIYRGLKSEDAAEAAFRKALEMESDNYHCYYQLARIYYKKEDYSHAQWFCEQALAIQPKDPEHWNLWAYIQYKKWFKINKDDHVSPLKIPREVLEYRLNATMLAWRALCKALIKGDRIQKYEQTARISLRHLAKATGKKLSRKSRGLFRQAFFLEPDNNDLFFELGKYFYRLGKVKAKRKNKKGRKNYLRAYDAFSRVFEDDIAIGDPCSFWTFNLCVNAELYEIENTDIYLDGIRQSYHHFRECAAKELHITMDVTENKEDEFYMPKREVKFADYNNRIAAALDKIGDTVRGAQVKFIPELSRFFKQIKDIRDSAEILAKEKEIIEKIALTFRGEVEENRGWPTAHVKIITAKILLTIGTFAEFDKIILRLKDAIWILKKESPYELKILELYLYLAQGYFKWKKYDQALIWAREGVKLDPYEPKIRQILVEIHFALREYSRGLDESAISLNLKTQRNFDIIKKIGNAYKEKVNKQDDPGLKEKFLQKAMNYFDHALKIMEDKSFPVESGVFKAREYTENLGEIHFYLGFFLFKQKKYNAARGHFQIVHKMGYKNRQNMVKLGWEFLEEKFLNEAEHVFCAAEANESQDDLTVSMGHTDSMESTEYMEPRTLKAQIKLGLAAVFIERAVGFHKENLPEKPLLLLKNAEASIADAADGPGKIRLTALFHRFQGLFYFKLEKYTEALQEFEVAASFMTNPAVYYYLAEIHWRLGQDKEAVDRKSHLRSANAACKLCLEHDRQKQYEGEARELLKKITELK